MRTPARSGPRPLAGPGAELDEQCHRVVVQLRARLVQQRPKPAGGRARVDVCATLPHQVPHHRARPLHALGDLTGHDRAWGARAVEALVASGLRAMHFDEAGVAGLCAALNGLTLT